MKYRLNQLLPRSLLNCISSYFLPDIALWLFPAYIHDTSMCEELFAFFHTVLDVLKSQMGAESIEATIGI